MENLPRILDTLVALGRARREAQGWRGEGLAARQAGFPRRSHALHSRC